MHDMILYIPTAASSEAAVFPGRNPARYISSKRIKWRVPFFASSITLTETGGAIARRIYDRHKVLTQFLVQLGVNEQTARKDACKIEHDISEETFTVLRSQLREV